VMLWREDCGLGVATRDVALLDTDTGLEDGDGSPDPRTGLLVDL
jgi:hypothetical protein